MIRTINFTGRKKILKEHVRITVRAGTGEAPPTFDALVDLGSYNFPVDARVFVEAYRTSAYQRFAFGIVKRLEPPQERALTEFGTGDGIKFRVKVDGPEGDPADPKPARLLGEADQVKPLFAGRRKSLLAIEPDTFSDEIWRLIIHEDSGPLLSVSAQLVPDGNALVKRPEFVSLVLPEILRRILIASFQCGVDPEDSPEHWACKWVRLAAQFKSDWRSPWEMEEAEQQKWLAEAVEAFARRYRVADRFRKWRSAGE